MKRLPRALIMDDEEDWRDDLAEIFGMLGFAVDTADNPQDARRLMNQNLYHIASLDIRIDATGEMEGMDLLRELHTHRFIGQTGPDVLKVIMVTAIDSASFMRETFRDRGGSDYVQKLDFSVDEFSQLVGDLLHQLQINLDLEILWRSGFTTAQAAVGIRMGDTRVKETDTETHRRATAELDDLLCRLFHKEAAILAEPMASGHSGAGVLWAQPSSPERGAGSAVVVKFGDYEEIEHEYRNYEDHVRRSQAGNFATRVETHRRTPLLGGIVYSLIGKHGERLQDFGEFYQAASAEQIEQLLAKVFRVTCGNWYAELGRRQPCNLTRQYQETLGFTPERLQKGFDQLSRAQGKEKLVFIALTDSQRRFPNPLLALDKGDLTELTYICTTHGDLNEHNILIDEQQNAWLIDFRHTGPGHILRDVAKLDSVIRCQLLPEEEATLDERLDLETKLLSADRFRDVPSLLGLAPLPNEALRKAFRTTVQLRTMAGRLVAADPDDSMRDYYIALFYYGLAHVLYYSLPRIQREHGLLSACLLAEKLNLGAR